MLKASGPSSGGEQAFLAGRFFLAGYLCPKGVALKELHEDPDRLCAPLVKRDGRCAAASWEWAFADLLLKLHQVIGFREDRLSESASGIPTLRCLFYDKDQLIPWPIP